MNSKPSTDGEDLVARLRSSDPASASEPDLAALRAAVDVRAAAQRDDLAVARSRRWTSWPARAAAVAAVALVVGGGGGYAVGLAGAGVPDATADGAALGPETMGGMSDEAPQEGPPVPGPLSAPRLGTPEAADLSSTPWQRGRTVLSAAGLSEVGGSASSWGFDAEATFTEGMAARAAEALGVQGAPTRAGGSWVVGPDDGSGPTLHLMADGTTTLSFYDPTTDPWGCVEVREEAAAAQEEGPLMPEPAPCEQRDLGPAPRGDAAVSSIEEVLGNLGLDPGAYEVVVEDTGDDIWTSLTAYHAVDGRRTGQQWSASLTGDGLQSLHGSLAPLVELGDYEVVSPAEAVERIADPRFDNGWGGFVGYRGPADGEPGAGASGDSGGGAADSAAAVPSTPERGTAVWWPVTVLTVAESTLGHALHVQEDGAAMLVPTYELVDEDGGSWSVIAVAESHLDLSGS